MKTLHPIKANQDFQNEVLTSVNNALSQGVSAKQLADYLDHVILRQLGALADKQLQAEMDAIKAEEKEGSDDQPGS